MESISNGLHLVIIGGIIMKEMTLQTAKISYDMLNGAKNRIYVTDSMEELSVMIVSAHRLLTDVYDYNLFRLTRVNIWNITEPMVDLYECKNEDISEDFMYYTERMFTTKNIVNLAELLSVCETLLNDICSKNIKRLTGEKY